MPNIQASIDGIRERAGELGTIKSGFDECNQQMRSIVQSLESEGAQKFNGAAGLEYKTQISIYANNLAKISNVFDVLQRTTDQSADILEAAQAKISQRLFSSKIATSSSNASSGNFINQDSVYQPSFEDVSFESMGNGTYRVTNDGVAVGYTDQAGYDIYHGND